MSLDTYTVGESGWVLNSVHAPCLRYGCSSGQDLRVHLQARQPSLHFQTRKLGAISNMLHPTPLTQQGFKSVGSVMALPVHQKTIPLASKHIIDIAPDMGHVSRLPPRTAFARALDGCIICVYSRGSRQPKPGRFLQ